MSAKKQSLVNVFHGVTRRSAERCVTLRKSASRVQAMRRKSGRAVASSREKMCYRTGVNVSSGGAGQSAKAGALLAVLQPCVSGWQQLLARRAGPTDPEAVRLLNLSADLCQQAQGLGFGGIAFHLTEFLRHFRDGGREASARGSLEAVGHLAEQVRAAVNAADRAAQDQRLADVRPQAAAYAPPPTQQHAAYAPPPALQQARPQPPPAYAPPPQHTQPQPRAQHQPPAPSPSGAPAPPPLLTYAGRMNGVAPLSRTGSGHAVRPPPLLNAERAASQAPPLALPAAAALPPPGNMPPRAGVEFAPSVAPPRPLSTVPPISPRSAALPPGAPNLFVRSMLGLRAFGKREASPNEPAPRGASTPPPEAPNLLHLKSQSAPPRGSNPPARLDRLPSGLPALEPAPLRLEARDAPGVGRSSSPSLPARERLSSSRPQRPSSRVKPSRIASQRQADAGWKVGLLVALGVLVALGGMVLLIVTLTRSQRDDPAPRAGASGSSQPATAPASSLAELPQLRLSTDSERIRSLLAQVHGRGKESPELRALVDEHAALAGRELGQQKCQGSPALCAEAAKVREAVLGKTGGHRVVRKRAPQSPDQLRSSWMVGLKLPEIPVEDDPRVRRRFEFYTENPVGRETFQAMLFRCGAHRDLIQSTLIRYGLPPDLIAVVFAESGCEPQATSPVGAAGLWQFMPATARAYHLRVIENTVDERRSPPKSTEAAIRYLRDMNEKLGSWDLTFAGYNMGPFGVLARIEQAGGGDVGFWDLVDMEMLPGETADYAPAIQAIALILNNLQRLKFASVQMRAPQLTSDLEVPPGTRLSLIARAAATSVVQLHALNLDVSGEQTPNVANFAIQVPKDVVWQARDALKELLVRHDDGDQCVPPTFDWGRQRFTEAMAAACQRAGKSTTPRPNP